MNLAELEVLRCPDCRGTFAFEGSPSVYRQHAPYGILRCECSQYPVVDGVPIILKGHVELLNFWSGEVESKGPSVEQITQLVAEGNGFEALVQCLAFTPRLGILERLPGWRLWHTGVVPRLGRKWIETRLRIMLRGDRRRLAAEDWFEFFFGDWTATDPSLLPVYRNRFVLPRTLAALSLLRFVPPAEKPVLDLACGFGPFGHYLTKRRHSTPVVGMDFNFYLVWGQRHWIAPSATFVCADASRRLPFGDDAFSSVLCSDAFVYFRNKQDVLAELNRCAPGKLLILTRVASKVSPIEPDALTPETYMKLLSSGRPRAFSEHALVRHYLAGRNPLACEPTEAGALHWDKWLTFVLNSHGLTAARLDPKEEWPHGTGELAFNPIFTRKSLPNGLHKLLFQFPTTWFAYQNGDMYGYHGDRIDCDPDTLVRARSGRAEPQVRDLIERFVIIGLPERYLRAQIRQPDSR